jgi:hypothetical protein
MITLPSFLGFLLPLPALLRKDEATGLTPRRRRAVEALRLSPHILRDVGMDSFETAVDDARWAQRPDLER